MKKHALCALALGIAAALAPFTASADARSATASLFANLERAGTGIGVTADNAVLAPTLVRGMYTLHNRQGKFFAYTNESGTVLGAADNFFVVSTSGAPMRPMSVNEKAEMRAEVMWNIEYDKLVRVSSGDGGGRRLLMFSSVDCPNCKAFEEVLQKSMRDTPTTIYVAPSSLRTIAQGGMSAWETASRIWCADNNGRAWQAFWQTRAVPAARQSCMTPQQAESAANNLQSILMGLDVKINGVPTLLREDAFVIQRPASFNRSYATMLGRAAQLGGLERPGKWLVAGNQPMDGQQYSQGQAQPMQQGGQQHGKVNAGDVLKKLFK